jgi:hypothetical protein
MENIWAIYHQEPDGWWAESQAIPGWTATAPSVDALRVLVEDGVRFALQRDDVIVQHALDTGAALVVFDFASGRPRVPVTAGASQAGRRQLQVA